MSLNSVSGHVRLPRRGAAPELNAATGWLNSAPLGMRELNGKVVLYAFWTYTCINWLRTLPYVRAWADAYADRGLTVVGVHTPEFAFEKDIENVKRAVAAQDIRFPVALDSEYAIWTAFDNHYWPAFYLADHEGTLRYEHFGEGRYVQTEQALKQLLRDAGAEVDDSLVQSHARPVEEPADWDHLKSPETYLGYARSDGAVSLSDAWTVRPDRISAREPAAELAIRFHARDLHLVMAPSVQGTPVPFQVTIDGHEPGDDHGFDVDAAGLGYLAEPRMYQLVRQHGPITNRDAAISFPDAGADAYVLTFG
jgi:thiol-disulfide isomerase/thioredoxin